MAMKKKIAGKIKFVGDQKMIREAIKKRESNNEELHNTSRDRQAADQSVSRQDEGTDEETD